MALHPDLVEILRCPITKAPLVVDGERIVSTDPETRLCYRIDNDIPVMLIDEAVTLDEKEWQDVMKKHGVK